MLTVEAEIDALVTAGLLTEKQATAFVFREIEATPRWAVAKEMGISTSTVDDHVGEAKRKIRRARETVAALDSIRDQLDSDD